MSDLYERLAAAADGDWGKEAAIDLLAAHGRWLPTLDEHRFITYDQNAYLDDGHGQYMALATIDWENIALILRMHSVPGNDPAALALRAGSGSERNILELACSLAEGHPVSARHMLDSLDRNNLRLALNAIAHAAAGSGYANTILPIQDPR